MSFRVRARARRLASHGFLFVRSTNSPRHKQPSLKVHIAGRDSGQDVWRALCGAVLETAEIVTVGEPTVVTCDKCLGLVPDLEEAVRIESNMPEWRLIT